MIETTSVYIGLLRADGSEPSALSGYQRIYTGEAPLPQIPELVSQNQIAFDAVTAPGYGGITAIAAFRTQQDGDPVWEQQLPMALDIHEGVIPFIFKGQLVRGLEVQAQVIMQSDDLCGF